MQKTLKQICTELDISRRVIQGYEQRGLVCPTGRNPYGHLLYDSATQERIRTIRFYQQIGFPLKTIQELVDAPVAVKKIALLQQVERLKMQQSALQQRIDRLQQYIQTL